MKKLIFIIVIIFFMGISLQNSSAQDSWTTTALPGTIVKDKNSSYSSKDLTISKIVKCTNSIVTIGDDTFDPETSKYLLMIDGNMTAGRIEVRANVWADDVFETDYIRMTLYELEKFINENKHLPDVPTLKEVTENKLDLAGMDATLLRKVEELTLYIIEQEKRIAALEEQLKSLNQ